MITIDLMGYSEDTLVKETIEKKQTVDDVKENSIVKSYKDIKQLQLILVNFKNNQEVK
jgi:hypothetical protein